MNNYIILYCLLIIYNIVIVLYDSYSSLKFMVHTLAVHYMKFNLWLNQVNIEVDSGWGRGHPAN